MDYSASGVDICRADRLVNWIKTQSPKHHQDRILSSVGGFASLFRVRFPDMEDPCLASSTDGVGTKLKLALKYDSLKSLGQDLVAMCVNDLLCVGAQPLFFLDYYACGKLDEKRAQEFITGIQEACIQAECSLIGGETAEMPGLYKDKDFDCAGFAVGIVDRKNIIGASQVQEGDQLIAIASHGCHSNGYSLLRKVFESDLDQWSQELLKPTALYTALFQKVLKNRVHALAHITGGGIDNILRVVPQGSFIQLHPWEIPSIFLEAKKRAQLSFQQLIKTLNCGIGLVAIASPSSAKNILTDLHQIDCHSWIVGEVSKIDKNQESTWNLNFKKWDNL